MVELRREALVVLQPRVGPAALHCAVHGDAERPAVAVGDPLVEELLQRRVGVCAVAGREGRTRGRWLCGMALRGALKRAWFAGV